MILNAHHIERFLRRVDAAFPIPLSHKQDLRQYSQKLCEKATLCAEVENESILAMVAGYTENVTDDMAYISLVATVKEARGRGLASKLVREFMAIAKERGLAAVHLYAVRSNAPAMQMYTKLGFV